MKTSKFQLQHVTSVYFIVLYLNSCMAENLTLTKAGIYYNAVANLPNLLRRLTNNFYRDGLPDELIDFYAPVNASNPLCKNESLLYKNALKGFDPWAVRMWDSSGKIPQGMMNLHLYDLGNYPECLEVPETGPYQVKYCLIRIGNWSAVWNTGFDWENKDAIIFGNLRVMKPEFYLARCVPASCNEDDMRIHFSPLLEQYNLTFKIDKLSCTASDENEPYSILDWFMIAFLLLTVWLLMMSTMIDYFTSNEDKKGTIIKCVMCFSLKKNIGEILKKSNPNNDFRFLNGLRAISMLLLMSSHNGFAYFMSPKVNLLQILKDLEKPTIGFALLLFHNKVVDFFFVFTGLLVAYSIANDNKLGKKFNLHLYYLKRLIRIVPMYAVQIAFLITISYRHMGYGPLWKFTFGIPREHCINYWWTNFLFINNYVHTDKMCIGSNWYLAVDTQLFALAPFIVIPMIKWKHFRLFGVPLIIICANTYTFYTSYSNKYFADVVLKHDFQTEREVNNLYSTTNSRAGCFLLGVLLGYYLFAIKNEGKKVTLSKKVLWFGWIIALLILSIDLIFTSSFMSTKTFDNLITALYNGYSRTICATTVCWIIFVCELGYGGIINDVFTWHPLDMLGKLSFAAYLFQLGFLNGLDVIASTSLGYSFWENLKNNYAKIHITYIFAFISHLMFEAPYRNLGNIFLKDGGKVIQSSEKDK